MGQVVTNVVGVNSWIDFAVALGILAINWIVILLSQRAFQRWSTVERRNGFLYRLVKAGAPPLFHMLQALSIYFAFNYLHHRGAAEHLLQWYAAICLTIGLARICTRVAGALFEEHWSRQTADRRAMDRQLRGFMPVITILVWGIALIGLMDNMGVKISAVVAGLGIGGVAIALASQAVLADLFAYFAILFDRPFDIEDTIAVDQFTGTVEYIGIKTTRLRSISGELVILSNSDLTRSRVRNFRQLKTRRSEFNFPVAYDNPRDKLAQLPTLTATVIKEQSMAKLEAAHLTGVMRHAFRFTVACQILSESQDDYLTVQQGILLGLKQMLDDHGILLASSIAAPVAPSVEVAAPPVMQILTGDRPRS
jgi:small-conductance mechanosensitive channel